MVFEANSNKIAFERVFNNISKGLYVNSPF